MSSTKEDEDREAFLPKSSEDTEFSEDGAREPNSAWKGCLRIFVEVLMAVVILGFLVRPSKSIVKPAATAVPAFPLKTYTFVENPRYLHEDMFSSRTETLHTLHNWIELSSEGRGYVKINNSESFGLSEPYMLNAPHSDQETPVYMMSVFHQLHCLSYLVEKFQSAIENGRVDQEVAHHSAHCFDYLRQSIMCNADTSLEGETEAGPGWGSNHLCKDYDAVLAWANEHNGAMFRNALMPDEATL